jgi:hypothetical protein
MTGILASLAPPGTAKGRCPCLSTDEQIIAALQVKTRTYSAEKRWHMSSRHESIIDGKAFYAFATSNLPCL